MHSRLVAFVLSLCAPLVAAQATVHVPGDYADLQLALDSVAPHTIVVVHGGTWSGLTVTNPVTLVGDPRPTIEAAPPASFGAPLVPPLTLAGPGFGAVNLVDVLVDGPGPPLFSINAPGVVGGGFEYVAIVDSEVNAPPLGLPFDSYVSGEPAVDLDVPRVTVARSILRASASGDANTVAAGLPGAPGLRTTQTAIVLDATIEGGGHLGALSLFGSCFMNPGPCAGPPGRGGNAVEAAAVYRSSATLVPGVGATWVDAFGTNCCTADDGQPVAAALDLDLPDALDLATPVHVGGPLDYVFDACACPGLLFASRGGPEVVTLAFGTVFVDPVGFFLLAALPDVSPAAGVVTVSTIPADPTLAGRVYTSQLWTPQGLTRPVVVSLLP